MSTPGDGAARPRPQYGEYATPEEQRAHIRQPDTTWAFEPHPEQPAVSGVAPVPAFDAPAPAPARVLDRVATFALLVYGLINVVSSVPSLLDFDAYAAVLFEILGVDATLADPAGAQPWGYAAAAVLVIGWLATAALSWWNMGRGRLSFWIPLAGGVVFVTLSGILMMVPLVNDPGVWDALLTAAG